MQGPTTRLTKERRKGQGGRLPTERKGGARQARGIMLAGRRNDFFIYTTTGHGGDGVGFFYQKGIFLIYTSTGGGGLGVCFLCDGILLERLRRRRRGEGSFPTYTTTGHGGDGVGFFYQKEFSLYTRALEVEARGCVSFVTELFSESG